MRSNRPDVAPAQALPQALRSREEALINQPTFGRAASADLPAVVALLRACELPVEDLRPEHLQHFWVCRRGDRVIGTVGFEVLGEDGLLRSLAVSPDARGERVSDGLWARIRDDAAANRIRRLYLLTTTADRLFAKWGFHPVARDAVPAAITGTAEYRSLCPSTATVMTVTVGDANGARLEDVTE